MSNEFILIFLLGLIVGVIVSFILLSIVYAKRQKKILEQLSAIDEEKKQAQKELSESSSQVAIVNERLKHIDEIKHNLSAIQDEKKQIENERNKLAIEVAQLKTDEAKSKEYFAERIADLNLVHGRMKEAFAQISKESVINNADLLSKSFKESMEQFLKTNEVERSTRNQQLSKIIDPLKENLRLVDQKVLELEKNRQGAYSGLKAQIDNLLKSQSSLQQETKNLAQALTAPSIRGRWGEMQLRRVVELSGLSAHCDFVEQKSIKDGNDVFRPDMIVTLPRNKKIVIDAKAPLDMFGSSNLDDVSDSENNKMDFAAAIKRHLQTLKKKSYFKALGESPEFIVMFLPGEAFLARALASDPQLLDHAAQNEVIIATPITLVALLKAIAFGFKQDAIAENIEEVRHLSQQLIDRIAKVSEHFDKLGRHLRQGCESYNQTLSSLESRVLVTARKLSDIKTLASDGQEEKNFKLTRVEVVPRQTSMTTDL